jgi:hypothetical protein
MPQEDIRPMGEDGLATAHESHAYIDWGAIVIGSIVALASSLLASAFGAAIGLSISNPYNGPKPLFHYWALGLWVLWVTVLTFLAGGYAAGRVRSPTSVPSTEARFRDGMHGLAVWALVVILGTALTSDMIMTSKSKMEPTRNPEPHIRFSDWLLRGDGDIKDTGPQIDESTRRVVDHIVAMSPSGDFKDRDRDYLVNVLSARTSLSPPDAERRIAEVAVEMKADAEKERERADRARKVGVILAFFTASTLAIGAATCWAAAKRGAAHQDECNHAGL